jgi:hypothetical protein
MRRRYVMPEDSPPPVVKTARVYEYGMEDFKSRLSLGDPHDVLTVHIRWDGRVQVQMAGGLCLPRSTGRT